MNAVSRAALVALLAACQPGPGEAPPPEAGEPARTLELATEAPARPSEQLPPERIYYELTQYDWYARGEPLLHDGQQYQPAGLPMAAPLSEMQRVGEYGGVEYYRHRNDDELLFVPVHEGYWLVFRPGARPVASAD